MTKQEALRLYRKLYWLRLDLENSESVSGSSGSEARPLQVLSTTARSDGIVNRRSGWLDAIGNSPAKTPLA